MEWPVDMRRPETARNQAPVCRCGLKRVVAWAQTATSIVASVHLPHREVFASTSIILSAADEAPRPARVLSPFRVDSYTQGVLQRL